MKYVLHRRGTHSGHTYPVDQLMNLDPVDGRPVIFELDLEAIGKDFPARSWLDESCRNMWRYGPLLPIESPMSLGEGWTPLLRQDESPRDFDLYIKDEGISHGPSWGANPTASFKDRGMAMVVNCAKRAGLTRLVVPTQGNAGDSLCRYARAAGLEVAVIMPDDTPGAIIGGVASAAHRDSGVTLELVRGTIREAGLRMKEKYLPAGYFNCATFQEPGWRVEGKKTLGLEIAEQLGWHLPDVIVYPTGGGTGILGMHKAFQELLGLGVVKGPIPRFCCVQSSVTAPLVRAWEAGAADTTPVKDPGHTLATGLNVPGGVGHGQVLRIVRETSGVVMAVAESSIAEEMRRGLNNGLWLAPEGAACVAALADLRADGTISAADRVVVVNTGSFDKYLPEVRTVFTPAGG